MVHTPVTIEGRRAPGRGLCETIGMGTHRALARAVSAALAIGGLTTGTAWAEQSSFRLTYDAPRPCPNETAVSESILSHSRRGRLATGDELARTIELEVRTDHGEFIGALSFVDLERRPVRRELRAPTCDELVQALVLVTALAIDAQAPSEVWAGRVDAPMEYYAPLGPEIAAAAVTVEASPFEPGLSAPCPPVAALALARMNTAAVPGWGMGLAGLVRLPWPAARVTTELGLGWSAGSAHAQGESARFDVTHGIARLCAWALESAAVGTGGCGGVEAGALLAQGHATDRITEVFRRSSAWLGLALVGRLRFRLGSRLGVESELGGLVPLYRPEFELDLPDVSSNLPLFRSPRIGLVAGLGLGLALD